MLQGHSEANFETVGFQEFSPSADSVSEARHFVEATLQPYGFGADLVYGCQLVADEFATNALLHAGSFFSVGVEVSGASVRIAVRDDSNSYPVLLDSSVESLSGRGLSIVAKTAAEWGAESLGRGKETWADVIISPLP